MQNAGALDGKNERARPARKEKRENPLIFSELRSKYLIFIKTKEGEIRRHAKHVRGIFPSREKEGWYDLLANGRSDAEAEGAGAAPVAAVGALAFRYRYGALV
jgi:hypothetical protein